MKKFVIDLGHGLNKAISLPEDGGVGMRLAIPHALVSLTPQQSEVALQMGAAHDVFIVDGVSYAVGAAAERVGIVKRTRSARYTRDYFGALAAILAYKMFGAINPEMCRLLVYASYPPGDIAFLDDLRGSLDGEFHISGGFGDIAISFPKIGVFPEGLGAWFGAIVADDGITYMNPAAAEGYALFIDVGNTTTEMGGIAPGGNIMPEPQLSLPFGIGDPLRALEMGIIAAHSGLFKGTQGLQPSRLRDAARFGTFVGGGRKLDVSAQVEMAMAPLLNQIALAFQEHAGGAMQWDTIIVAGGGGGVLFPHMSQVLGHDNVIPAATPLEDMIYCNANGGAKLLRLRETMARQGDS